MVLCIDKPYGWSSFDVIRRIKKILAGKKIKIGHAGTLDPLATGILLICLEQSTKIAETLQAQQKKYRCTLKIGSTTPSFDLETPIDKTFDFSEITTTQIQHTISSFIGEQLQMPPMFSAKQIDGKRAYDEIRKGNQLDLKPSQITIFDIVICDVDLPHITLEITCSKGTYIRAIARDIGERLNVGAHLVKLERTGNGSYDEFQMKSMQAVEEEILQLYVRN